MAEPKGDKLYVNLSASQTRRRLKGFGHGVRKIQSAGRNQAVVIHTARGRNLDALMAQFQDVGCSLAGNTLAEPIDNLLNIGPTSADWLRDIGIRTIADLERFGPAAAFRLVQAKRSGVSWNLLYALVAGLEGKLLSELSDDERGSLRRQAELG